MLCAASGLSNSSSSNNRWWTCNKKTARLLSKLMCQSYLKAGKKGPLKWKFKWQQWRQLELKLKMLLTIGPNKNYKRQSLLSEGFCDRKCYVNHWMILSSLHPKRDCQNNSAFIQIKVGNYITSHNLLQRQEVKHYQLWDSRTLSIITVYYRPLSKKLHLWVENGLSWSWTHFFQAEKDN